MSTNEKVSSTPATAAGQAAADTDATDLIER